MPHYQTIHEQALRCARQYKKSQHELLCILQQVDAKRVYLRQGYKNLFDYCIKCLKLSEGTTYAIIRVARKSIEIPEIENAIAQGTLTLSHAKSIVSVITPETKTEWLEKAKTMSVHALEREVAKLNPSALPLEKMKVVAKNTIKLECGIDFDTEKMIIRVKDLLSQKRKQAVKLDAAIKEVFSSYLERNDPLLRKRHSTAKKGPSDVRLKKLPTRTKNSKENLSSDSKLRRIPSKIKTQVLQRDKGVCQAIDSVGTHCVQRRWLDIHHKLPVSKGGTHELSNLITLCNAHHRLTHLNNNPMAIPMIE